MNFLGTLFYACRGRHSLGGGGCYAYGPNEARNQALEPRNRALGGPCPLVISHVDPLGPSSYPGGNILALFGSGLAHVRP